MPSFSKRSMDKLETCHGDLIALFVVVVQHRDCTILCGQRGEAEQTEYFRTGRSKVEFPNSKHNKTPSLAVDVAPYFKERPHIRWNDRNSFYHFAGFVLGVAEMMKIKIRYGGNWDGDDELSDQTFFDLPHYELIL